MGAAAGLGVEGPSEGRRRARIERRAREHDARRPVENDQRRDAPLAEGVRQTEVLVGELRIGEGPCARAKAAIVCGRSPTATPTTEPPQAATARARRSSPGSSRTQGSHQGAQKLTRAGRWPMTLASAAGWPSALTSSMEVTSAPDAAGGAPPRGAEAQASARGQTTNEIRNENRRRMS